MYEKVWKKLHSWEFYRNNLDCFSQNLDKKFVNFIIFEGDMRKVDFKITYLLRYNLTCLSLPNFELKFARFTE